MLVVKALFCIGALALAGGCGVLLGLIEKKAMDEDERISQEGR